MSILREGASPDLLEAYSAEHVRQWRQLLAVGGGLAPGARAQAWARERCLSILPCIPATGDDLTHLAAQIGLELVPTGRL